MFIMKKLSTLVLAFVMLFVFAGCGKIDTSSNKDDTVETETVVSSETAKENDIIRQYAGLDDQQMATLISNRDFPVEIIEAISLANGYGSYEDACGYLWSQGYLKWFDHCPWCGDAHYRINYDNPEILW
jgi:hypothetical protein